MQALSRLGVRFMFGVVGIPVTPLASSAQVGGWEVKGGASLAAVLERCEHLGVGSKGGHIGVNI